MESLCYNGLETKAYTSVLSHWNIHRLDWETDLTMAGGWYFHDDSYCGNACRAPSWNLSPTVLYTRSWLREFTDLYKTHNLDNSRQKRGRGGVHWHISVTAKLTTYLCSKASPSTLAPIFGHIKLINSTVGDASTRDEKWSFLWFNYITLYMFGHILWFKWVCYIPT